MARPRLTTRERQAALFSPKPAPPLIVPPPNELPKQSGDEVQMDVDAFLKLPEDNRAVPAVPAGTRYFGFRTRHSRNSPWTNAPGRWPRIAQAAMYAKQAKELDPRLEVQIFGVR